MPAANYVCSLDHQDISFKMADKKALTTKAFVLQIEAIMETQMAHCATLVDPLYVRACPQHQLAYEVSLDDEAVVALSTCAMGSISKAGRRLVSSSAPAQS